MQIAHYAVRARCSLTKALLVARRTRQPEHTSVSPVSVSLFIAGEHQRETRRNTEIASKAEVGLMSTEDFQMLISISLSLPVYGAVTDTLFSFSEDGFSLTTYTESQKTV